MFENLFKKKLKYLVIGAGSTGATFACFLHSAGKNVTLLSKYDEIVQLAKEKGGINLISAVKGEHRYNVNIKTEKTYRGKADVIILCIRTPHLLSATDIIEKASHKKTVLFSISNGFGIGFALKKKYPDLKVLDANFVGKCRWFNRKDVEYLQQREYCELNLAPKEDDVDPKILNYIVEDFTQSGMKTTLMNENQFTEIAFERLITRSAFEACCIYYNINAHQIVDEKWETFDKLCKELLTLAKAMGINIRDNFLQEYYNNFELYKERDDANVYSSILNDMKIGQSSEIDFLFFIVLALAKEYNVDLPEYQKIAEKFEQYNTLYDYGFFE
ncbi:MAG: NAD(P)-binding domain-containing protein [Candidatus Gastranaerophilales bacterium]|nr:NAD(P)-binding domain-containing protein [Candidatus Gastranaerophilales bacterium]